MYPCHVQSLYLRTYIFTYLIKYFCIICLHFWCTVYSIRNKMSQSTSLSVVILLLFECIKNHFVKKLRRKSSFKIISKSQHHQSGFQLKKRIQSSEYKNLEHYGYHYLLSIQHNTHVSTYIRTQFNHGKFSLNLI